MSEEHKAALAIHRWRGGLSSFIEQTRVPTNFVNFLESPSAPKALHNEAMRKRGEVARVSRRDRVRDGDPRKTRLSDGPSFTKRSRDGPIDVVNRWLSSSSKGLARRPPRNGWVARAVRSFDAPVPRGEGEVNLPQKVEAASRRFLFLSCLEIRIRGGTT